MSALPAEAAGTYEAGTVAEHPHVLAIPGTGDPGHLEANVAAGGIRLDEDEVARLAEVSSSAAR